MSQKSVYKRLETDREFRLRIGGNAYFKTFSINTQVMIVTADGTNLDDYAWSHLTMQRRIIDDWT